jgi:hypothetical protein
MGTQAFGRIAEFSRLNGSKWRSGRAMRRARIDETVASPVPSWRRAHGGSLPERYGLRTDFDIKSPRGCPAVHFRTHRLGTRPVPVPTNGPPPERDFDALAFQRADRSSKPPTRASKQLQSQIEFTVPDCDLERWNWIRMWQADDVIEAIEHWKA